MKVCINRQLLDQESARIDPRDRGFTLGDGLYETISIRSGKPRRLGSHLARLRRGADVLSIPILYSDAQIEGMLESIVTANNVTEGSCRLTLTRGPSERGLAPPVAPIPTLLLTVAAGVPSTEAVDVILATRTCRNEHSPLAAIKSTNVLDSLLAHEEAQAAGADDALLSNTVGHLAEGTIANVFLLVDGGLITPPVKDGALPGIMRAEVIRLARAEERTVTPDVLARASEVFLTNALGLRPVVSINGHAVGDGEPGLITQMLAARL